MRGGPNVAADLPVCRGRVSWRQVSNLPRRSAVMPGRLEIGPHVNDRQTGRSAATSPIASEGTGREGGSFPAFRRTRGNNSVGESSYNATTTTGRWLDGTGEGCL